jgi:hypothetical protein
VALALVSRACATAGSTPPRTPTAPKITTHNSAKRRASRGQRAPPDRRRPHGFPRFDNPPTSATGLTLCHPLVAQVPRNSDAIEENLIGAAKIRTDPCHLRTGVANGNDPVIPLGPQNHPASVARTQDERGPAGGSLTPGALPSHADDMRVNYGRDGRPARQVPRVATHPTRLRATEGIRSLGIGFCLAEVRSSPARLGIATRGEAGAQPTWRDGTGGGPYRRLSPFRRSTVRRDASEAMAPPLEMRRA